MPSSALDAGQAASLSGLAPIARQSGRWTGHAFIRGGRAAVRQAIDIPALVATRFNPEIEGQVQGPHERMEAGAGCRRRRKLIVLVNAP